MLDLNLTWSWAAFAAAETTRGSTCWWLLPGPPLLAGAFTFTVQTKRDLLPRNPPAHWGGLRGDFQSPVSHQRLAGVFLRLMCINFNFITYCLCRRDTATYSQNNCEMKDFMYQVGSQLLASPHLQKSSASPPAEGTQRQPRALAWPWSGLSVDSAWTGRGLGVDSVWTWRGLCVDSVWTWRGLGVDSAWTGRGLRVDWH